MGAFYQTIPENLIDWALQQKVFWVATAPLSSRGHVNISPKGGAYFGIPDERTFWYMDLTGSGSETISHLYEKGNGRITVLFNAFSGPPRILRLYGVGQVLEFGSPKFERFTASNQMNIIAGSWAIIIVNIELVTTSCGFSVPLYEFQSYRTTLNDYFARKAERAAAGHETDSIERYWAYTNSWSMDGLPSMRRAQAISGVLQIDPAQKCVGSISYLYFNKPSSFGFQGITVSFCLVALGVIIGSGLAYFMFP